jgi:hypothetical protein
MNLDDRLKRAVDSLGDKLRDEIAKELSSLTLAQPRDEAGITGINRIADALRALDFAKSLTDILETLATAASNESARAGVFVISGDAIRSLSLFGFPATFEDAPIEMPLDRAGVIRDAIRQKVAATTTDGLFDTLPPDVTAMAIPIVLAGSPVGALYAEGADLPTLEILTRFAARALEAMTAMKTARAVADRDIG